MKPLLIMMVFAAALGACSSPPQEPAVVQMTPAEKAVAAEAAATALTLDSAQMDEVKQTLNSEGKACAEIVEIQPHEAENTLEVTCIENAGGTQRVTHRIDLGAI